MFKKYVLIGIVLAGSLALSSNVVQADDVPPCEPPDAEECQGPVFSGIADILLTTSDPDAQLEATYSVTAEDPQDGPVEVSCDPVSGSLFSVGDTQVTCTATDSNSNERTRAFYVTVQLEEAEEEGFDIAASITLPNGCTVTDNTGATHLYPTSTSTQYLAICALQEAIDEHIVDSIAFSDFGIGLFVDSVNGVRAPENAYWQLQQDGVSASTGASLLPIAAGDTVSLVLMEYDPETFADVGPIGYNLTLTIEALSQDFMNVVVPNMCTVSATSSTNPELSAEYDFPIESSPSDYLGVCALTAARGEGYLSNIGFIDFGFGLFLDSIDGIATDSDFDPFWALSVNGEEAMVGITDVPVEIGDMLTLSYAGDPAIVHTLRVIGLSEVVEEPEEETPPADTGTSGGGGGGGTSHRTFDVPAALAYLSAKQSSDGSFGSSMLTDWVAIAFAAADPGEAQTKLRAHMTSSAPSLSGALDYIRHAMALMALGIDPYAGTGVNYIAPITSAFDGTQIGDASLENDDIFSLFPLTHAGYSSSDEMVQKIVAFIVSRQLDNGSWTGDVDMTAAAIQALSPLSALPDVQNALTKAEAYMRTQQQAHGGFANSFATSWSMQAIAALGQQASSWAPAGLYLEDYLASLQQQDGGVENTSSNQQTRIWATAYAIPAATGKTWHALMNDFSRPTGSVAGAQTTSTEIATTTAATSTTAGATSTPSVATSTPAEATSTVVAEILTDIQDEGTPQESFTTRLAQTSVPAEAAPDTTEVIEVPETSEEAVRQVAAAAATGLNWNLIVLAFLALILFGITAYIAIVRKYWR